MRRRRTFLLIFIILVLLLVVGLIALWRLRGGDLFGGAENGEEVSTERPLIPLLQATPVPQTQFVVVALQTVTRGMRVPPDAIEVREWPLDDRDFPSDPALKERIRECFKRVHRYRQQHARILNLHFQGYSTDEICEKLRMSRNNFYVSLSRARSMLADCLREENRDI